AFKGFFIFAFLFFAAFALADGFTGPPVGGGFTGPGVGGGFTGPPVGGGFTGPGTALPSAPTFEQTPSGNTGSTGFDFTVPFTPSLPGGEFTQDLPARWNNLHDITIPQGTQDNTIIYPAVANQCEDPDSPEFVSVASSHASYNLFMQGTDLVISHLNAGYTGSEQVTLSCNGVQASFTLAVRNNGNGARWNTLSNQFVQKGSPDGTLVYPNIVSQCQDQTSAFLTFTVVSASPSYQLFFVGSDLRIFNLNSAFEGTDTVTLSCNNVPASFRLTVGTRTFEEFEESIVQENDLEVSIGAIALPDRAMPGEFVPVFVSFRNTGDAKLENVHVRVSLPDLGVFSASAGPFDLARGKRTTQTLLMELPEQVQEGTYAARVTIDSDSLHRIVHRDLVVE
ncbi:MAG TPA: hypothetical protein VJJ82_06055, partial [Candidatus Nanoarchaeia archaeon]|nr:hypothetical protein [Candidatus Nanoarchaeia archaeon]